MNPSSLPPIASPHGAKAPLPASPQKTGDKRVAHLVVSFPLRAAFRYAALEWLSPGTLGVIFFLPLTIVLSLPILISRKQTWASSPLLYLVLLALIIALSAPLTLLVRLCSRRKFGIQISPSGLSKLYPSRDIHFPWSKFSWLLERNGDLWLASFVDGCFIPREIFSSRQEASDFALIVRELKSSNGLGWRREWNERVFGTHSYIYITPVETETIR